MTLNTMNPSRPRLWIGALALATTLAVTFGAAGCSTDSLTQTQKAVGEEAGEILPPPDPATIEAISTATASTEKGGDTSATGPEVPADAILPTSQPEAPVETKPLKADQKMGPRAAMTVHTSPGLTKFGTDVTGGGCRGYNESSAEIPGKIAANSWASWCFQGDVLGAAEIQANFTIDGTKDLLWTHTKIPTVGDNIVQCSILDQRTWKPQTRSRYSCKVEWTADGGHGLNPKPQVTLWEKPTDVITNAAEAQKLLEENCTQGQPTCTFKSAKQEVVTPDRANWRILHSYSNCGSVRNEPGKHEWGKKVGHEIENTFATGVKVTVGKPETLGVAVEAKYTGKWSTEHVYEAAIDVPVAWGYQSFLYSQESNINIVGDFEIVTVNRLIRINDTKFQIPLSQTWTDENGVKHEPEKTHALAYPVKCPNEDIVPHDDKKHDEHDKKREKVLQSGPAMPENPTAEWLIDNGAEVTRLN